MLFDSGLAARIVWYMPKMFSFKRKPIRLSRLASSLLLSIALLFPLKSLGAEQSPEQALQPGFLDPADAPRDYLSGKFVSYVTDIDRFFGDERNYQESNKSVFQLDLTRVMEHGGNRKFVLSGRAKLHLPATEERLRVVVETDPDKNITGEPTKGQPVLLDQVVAPESYAVAARYEKAKESVWHFSTDAGIKLQSGLTPFARMRGSYSVPMGQWRLKATETVFWFNTIGVGESTQLDVERLLSEPMLFRASTNASWLRDKHNFDLRQDLSIYHALNERTALLYQTSAIGVSQPQLQTTEYVLLLLYRYRLHREWLFFELSPQLHYPRIKNFDSSPRLIVRLEMLLDESR